MDQELLVDQERDGQRLIEQLTRDGFDVAVAFWVKIHEDGLWRLYLASSQVDEDRPNEAYRTLYSALDKTPSKWVSPSDVKLIHDQNPIARAAIELRDRNPSRMGSPMGSHYRWMRLGDLTIPEGYIYRDTVSPRISFTASYRRLDDTNNWRARLGPGRLTRGIKAKGAVSYSTGFWEGEQEADRKHANVRVLVAIDPKFDDPDILNDPGLIRMTAEQARMMADEMFRSYHPEAVIEHGEDEAD